VILYWKLSFLLAMLLVSSRLSASEHLVWGYGDFPPYLYMHEDGQPQGIYADIVKNVFKHADIEYQTLLAPNRRVKKMIVDGLIEFAVSPKNTLDNPNDFYFSRAVVAKIDLRVYWIGDQPPVTQASDLNRQSVILISSFEYSGLRNYVENLDNKVTVAVDVEDHKRALSALSVKRGTYMLGYRAPVELMQLEMNIQDLYSYPIIQTDMYLMIHKSVKNSRQIMDKLDISYSALYPNNVDAETVN
jgi:polar amino acid transport system substrate-binding protein